MTTLRQYLRSELRKLGRSPNQIAKSLQKRKIKGNIAETFTCPIAEFIKKKIKRKTKKDLLVEVIPDKVTIGKEYREDMTIVQESIVTEFNLNIHIKNFIWNFDNSTYPALIKN